MNTIQKNGKPSNCHQTKYPAHLSTPRSTLLNSLSDKGAVGNSFPTTDIYIAAFLVVNGIKMIRTKRNNFGRTFFIFEDSGRITELISSYIGGAQVSVSQLKSAIQDLKAVMFGGGK